MQGMPIGSVVRYPGISANIISSSPYVIYILWSPTVKSSTPLIWRPHSRRQIYMSSLLVLVSCSWLLCNPATSFVNRDIIGVTGLLIAHGLYKVYIYIPLALSLLIFFLVGRHSILHIRGRALGLALSTARMDYGHTLGSPNARSPITRRSACATFRSPE